MTTSLQRVTTRTSPAPAGIPSQASATESALDQQQQALVEVGEPRDPGFIEPFDDAPQNDGPLPKLGEATPGSIAAAINPASRPVSSCFFTKHS